MTTRGKRIISRSDSSTVVTYEEMLLMVSRAQFISVGNYNSNYLIRGEPASAAHEDVFIRFLWKYQQIVPRVVLHSSSSFDQLELAIDRPFLSLWCQWGVVTAFWLPWQRPVYMARASVVHVIHVVNRKRTTFQISDISVDEPGPVKTSEHFKISFSPRLHLRKVVSCVSARHTHRSPAS